jgi:hypothetical protein
MTRTKAMAMGAMWAIAGAIVTAIVMNFIFDFPVPFSGRVHGIEGVIPTLFGIVVYGVFGGVLVFALVGAAAGAVAFRNEMPDSDGVCFLTKAYSLLVSIVLTLLLANLDRILGL